MAFEGSISKVLEDLATSAKNLVTNELKLLELQIGAVAGNISQQLKLLILFSSVCIIAAIPLMASAVLGLGQALEHRYWLSSLIVGVFMIAIGFALVANYKQKIKNTEQELAKVSSALKEGTKRVQEKVVDASNTITGE